MLIAARSGLPSRFAAKESPRAPQRAHAPCPERKVVWHGNVYQAKWWTRGELPDAPVVHEWETPWQFVGPVLPGERRARVTATTMAAGIYPEWSATKVYEKGARVLQGGLPYEAKWWTEGDRPDTDVDNEWETPWKPLFGATGE